MRPLVVVTLTCALAAVACADSSEEATPASSELVGVVVAVDPPTGPVEAFTLEAEGDSWEIFIADDVDYGFDLQHLREHRATGDPVRCTLEERGERLYALTILDA